MEFPQIESYQKLIWLWCDRIIIRMPSIQNEFHWSMMIKKRKTSRFNSFCPFIHFCECCLYHVIIYSVVIDGIDEWLNDQYLWLGVHETCDELKFIQQQRHRTEFSLARASKFITLWYYTRTQQTTTVHGSVSWSDVWQDFFFFFTIIFEKKRKSPDQTNVFRFIFLIHYTFQDDFFQRESIFFFHVVTQGYFSERRAFFPMKFA